MNFKEYKDLGKEELVFSDLVSDVPLIKKVKDLEFEDELDKRSIDHILRQQPKIGLSKIQRKWFQSLLDRIGKKFKN